MQSGCYSRRHPKTFFYYKSLWLYKTQLFHRIQFQQVEKYIFDQKESVGLKGKKEEGARCIHTHTRIESKQTQE